MMIDIDHVSFQYSGAERENLQDFNLQIEKGECVVLTGESGCGKTCVTRLINTLIPHFYEGEMSGTVLIDGVDTRTIQPHDLSDKIGSVFQNPRSQFFSLDTDSEIVFGMENKGMPYQVMLDRYQQTIRELHIEKLKDRNLFDLSGGQKQRVAIAGIIAMRPKCIVLGEPTAMLDPRGRKEVMETIHKLNKEYGITVVLITHYMDEAAQCDRIIVMDSGKVILDDTPKKVFSHVRELKNVGLDVPQTSELIYEFLKEGYNLPKDVLTEEECIKAITTLFRRKGIKPQLSKETQEQPSDEQIV